MVRLLLKCFGFFLHLKHIIRRGVIFIQKKLSKNKSRKNFYPEVLTKNVFIQNVRDLFYIIIYTNNMVYISFTIPWRDSNPGHFELQSKTHDKLDRSAIAPLLPCIKLVDECIHFAIPLPMSRNLPGVSNLGSWEWQK